MINLEEVQEDLQLLEIKLKILKRDYELYFNGLEKREPLRLKEQVTKIIRKYLNEYIPNTALKFKYQSLVATFNTLNNYWMRIVAQIEAGTYSKDKFRAELHRRELEKNLPKIAEEEKNIKKEVPLQTSTPSEDKYKKLYDQFIKAKSECGQKSDITLEQMKKLIIERYLEIKKKYNCKKVEFKVVIEGGKAKLKGIPIIE